MKELRKLYLLMMASLVFNASVTFCLDADKVTKKYTDDELQKAYDSMSDSDREYLKTLAPEERDSILKLRAETNRLIEANNGKPLEKPFIIDTREKQYELDPLLEKAYLAYLDQAVSRDKVIGLFQEYVDNEPNSIFLPEIYFNIATLYSVDRRRGMGEKRDIEKATEYYRKAHDLYREKFSYKHRTAWATITNYPNSNIDERIAYYGWLQELANHLTAEDVYPVRTIGHAYLGFKPIWTAKERQQVAAALKKKETIPRAIKVAEENILWRTSYRYPDLVKLAETFPDTELGRQAEKRLKELAQGLLSNLYEIPDVREPQ